uniref:tyrosine-type recombinase/integrase n=1 Tax=Agathobacter sp. TaxID=2021311 RepID=UPI00405786F7
MPKRGENIYKRKDGRWEGRYRIKSDSNETTKYKSVYGKTYKEVKEKMMLQKQEAATWQKRKNEPLFSDVLEMWILENRVHFKGATEHKYQSMIEMHISPGLGQIKVSKLTSSDIHAFLENKRKHGRMDGKGGLSVSYIKSMVLVIHAAINYAAEEGWCEPLRKPAVKLAFEKREIPVLNRVEQKQLESHLLKNTDETKLGMLISLHMGLRIGEVCALSWEDIDFQGEILHVRHTVARVRADANENAKTKLILDKPKTKSSTRDIPISSALMQVFSQMKLSAKSSYVISAKPGFISPRTYEYRYHKVLEECGLASVNYHALRHSFATKCVEAGVDVKTLSEILGHADVAITLNTYVHSSMDMKRKQLEKLMRE